MIIDLGGLYCFCKPPHLATGLVTQTTYLLVGLLMRCLVAKLNLHQICVTL